MDYDILIIGSGPAGQHAAWHGARFSQKCVNYPTLAECYKLAALDCVHQLNQNSRQKW